MEAETLDLELSGGRVRAERRGGAGGPLALCVHGLSGNLRSFDRIASRLASDGRQVVAVDLRGRGRSEVTPPGTYGLAAHARDVVEIASQLGAERFDVVGWSMGGLIGIVVASEAPDRLRRLAIIDHAGGMDEGALAAIRAGLARLDAVVEAPEQYVQAIRAAGAIDPWSELWDDVYRYELGRSDGRWSPTTSRAACDEDLDVGAVERVQALWPALTMPVLLVRASVPLNGGFIVPEDVLASFREAVPHLRVAEVGGNHFTIMDDDATADAIASLLGD
jgi:pimeloyl-ACP methyl ester carboxylesterase